MAGAATELAKPVIGTSEPAPPYFVILGYIPNAVNATEMKIKVMDTHVDDVTLSISKKYVKTFLKP